MVLPVIAAGGRAALGAAAKGVGRGVTRNGVRNVHVAQRANQRRNPSNNRPTWREAEPARPTTDSIFRNRYDDPFRSEEAETNKDQSEELRRQKRVRKIQKLRQVLKTHRAGGADLVGLGKSFRVKRSIQAGLVAAVVCLPFFGYQVIFWMIALTGMGIEADALDAGELLDLNKAEKAALWATGKLLPGQTIFMLGWVVSSVLGLLQLAITGAIFAARMVNPFRGSGYPGLGIAFAFTMLPLGLFPWAYLWIYTVVKSQSEPK